MVKPEVIELTLSSEQIVGILEVFVELANQFKETNKKINELIEVLKKLKDE